MEDRSRKHYDMDQENCYVDREGDVWVYSGDSEAWHYVTEDGLSSDFYEEPEAFEPFIEMEVVPARIIQAWLYRQMCRRSQR